MSADPISLASTAATVVKAGGQILGGGSKKDAAEYNARVAEDNARLASEKAALDARRVRRMADETKGSIRAAAGASGITMSGSAMDVMAETATLAEEDVLLVQHSGEVRADNLMKEAALSQFQGKQAKKSSYISSASTLLRGFEPISDVAGSIF